MPQPRLNSNNPASAYPKNHRKALEEYTPTEIEYRIGMLAASIAVAITALVDIGQFILNLAGGTGVIINRFVTVAAYASFAVWFTLRKVSVLDPEILKGLIAGGVAEALPVIDSLPALTVSVIRVIKQSRAEDRKKAFEKRKAQAKKPVVLPARQVNDDSADQITPTGRKTNIAQPNMTPEPVNLTNDITSPTKPSAEIIDIQSLGAPEPINLAAEPDEYREAA